MSRLPTRREFVAAQRADADITLIFDGGSLGNPGTGYGSALVSSGERPPRLLSFEFDGQRTSNEAEYLTLIHALRRVLLELNDDTGTAGSVSIAMLSDSMLVVEQLNGRWKVRNPRLRPLHTEAVELIGRFGSSTISWHPRHESVRILGH